MESLCRLCLKNNFSLESIYNYHCHSGEAIVEVLENMYDLKICEGDGLPTKICLPCIWKVVDSEVNRKKVIQAETELRKFLNRTCNESNGVSEEGIYNVTELMAEGEMNVANDQLEAIACDTEVSLYNEESLPQVEPTVNDDRIGVSEQLEREQKSKDSAFNVAECPIKTELVEDEDEMSKEAENDKIPERHDDSPQSRKQVWFQMNPAESEVYVSSEQRDAENVPESSSYHLDRYPISNRKLGAGGKVIYSRTCSSLRNGFSCWCC